MVYLCLDPLYQPIHIMTWHVSRQGARWMSTTGTPIPSDRVVVVHRENLCCHWAGSTLVTSLLISLDFSGSHLSPPPQEHSNFAFLVYLCSGFHELDFLEPDLLFCLFDVHVCDCVCEYYLCGTQRVVPRRKAPDLPELETDSCEPPDTGAGNLWKSSKCS